MADRLEYEFDISKFPELAEEQRLDDNLDNIQLSVSVMDKIQDKVNYIMAHRYTPNKTRNQLFYDMVKKEKMKILNKLKEEGKIK